MENEFPPNSHNQKETRERRGPEKSDRREVGRVARGRVIQRKKSLRRKVVEAFRPEDNVGFVEYTVLEVLVPGIKDALADAIHGTIDNALGVGGGRRHRRDSSRGGYTSYSRMGSGRSRRDRDDDDRRGSRREPRRGDDAREIIFDSRVEAEEVLDNMIELLSKYDNVTMRDLLSMAGEPHNTTHEDWGWTDLRGARIHKIRDGYLLDLPRAESLD